MKNKFKKLFQKVKSENRMYLSMMSFLTLAIFGMLFQSFTMDSVDGTKKSIGFDEELKTTYSFGCDISMVSQTDLIQSQSKTVNQHIDHEINSKNEVIITTNILDQPNSEHDLEHLVQKIIWTGDATLMYGYDGREIITNIPVDESQVKRLVSDEQLEYYGLFPTLTIPSSSDIAQLQQNGYTVNLEGNTVYTISNEEEVVTIDVSKNYIEIRALGMNRLFDKQTTFYKDLGNGKSIKSLTMTEDKDILPSGQERIRTVISTRKNHLIQENGIVVFGGKDRIKG
jgi:hypothetical protein